MAKKKSSVLETTIKITKLNKVKKKVLGNFFSNFHGFFVAYYWGEKRLFYLLLVGIIFPIIVFIFFETILGLRFPPGIITNIYYS